MSYNLLEVLPPRKHIFTNKEKNCLLDILKKHMSVIESRVLDAASIRAKNNTWIAISREYNAKPEVEYQASATQLKKLWMNLKQRKRYAIKNSRIVLKKEPVDTGYDKAEKLQPKEINVVNVEEEDSNNTFDNEFLKDEIRQDVRQALQSDLHLAPERVCKEPTTWQKRVEELHALQMELMRHRVREAKAKADLAEFLRDQKCSQNIFVTDSFVSHNDDIEDNED